MEPRRSTPPGTIQVTATSPVEMLLKRPLRFEPPLIELASNPDGFRFWWGQLQQIFDINDPREFRPLPNPLPQEERDVLERFVSKARELAASSGLNAEGGIEVSISDDSQTETVTTNLPASDIVAGFSAIFRQFFAPDERASFKNASGVLMKAAKAADDADDAEARVEELRGWGKAAGKLRINSVERLAHEKLVDEGRFPPLEEIRAGTYPDPENPQQVISTFLYGEHLHWSTDKAAVLVARERDAFEDARSKLFFLQATAGLSHIYIGYSLLVTAALARQ